MKFFDFCAGIGAGRLGLEKAGMTCVGYSEINRSAIKSYNLLHKTINEKNYGNLTKINVEDLPDFDLAIAGFPCQTFSVIGRQEGLKDTRGQIIFHILKLLVAKKTKYFLFENVKGLITHDGGKTIQTILDALKNSGYAVQHKVLSSMSYGVPQMRQRVYFVGVRKDLVIDGKKFKWSNEGECKKLSELLISENNLVCKEKLDNIVSYLNNKTNLGKVTLDEILQKENVVVDTRQSDIRLYYNRIPTLRSFRDGLYYVRDGKLRSLTGYEAMLVQGFPKDYADRVKDVSIRDLLRQTGNSMTVGVIESLGKSLKEYLKKSKAKEIAKKQDTLVGLVKSREQMKYCLDKNIYYTYNNTLSCDTKSIDKVAIYQTKSAFGVEGAGIFFIGKVKKTYLVKRSQVHFNTNNVKKDKECIVFKVIEWERLVEPILPSGNAKVLLLTSAENLERAKIYSDLMEL